MIVGGLVFFPYFKHLFFWERGSDCQLHDNIKNCKIHVHVLRKKTCSYCRCQMCSKTHQHQHQQQKDHRATSGNQAVSEGIAPAVGETSEDAHSEANWMLPQRMDSQVIGETDSRSRTSITQGASATSTTFLQLFMVAFSYFACFDHYFPSIQIVHGRKHKQQT